MQENKKRYEKECRLPFRRNKNKLEENDNKKKNRSIDIKLQEMAN